MAISTIEMHCKEGQRRVSAISMAITEERQIATFYLPVWRHMRVFTFVFYSSVATKRLLVRRLIRNQRRERSKDGNIIH